MVIGQDADTGGSPGQDADSSPTHANGMDAMQSLAPSASRQAWGQHVHSTNVLAWNDASLLFQAQPSFQMTSFDIVQAALSLYNP